MRPQSHWKRLEGMIIVTAQRSFYFLLCFLGSGDVECLKETQSRDGPLSFLAYTSSASLNTATPRVENSYGHWNLFINTACHSTTFFLLFIVLFGLRWRWLLERNSIQGWAIVFSRLYIIGLVKYGHTPSGKFLRLLNMMFVIACLKLIFIAWWWQYFIIFNFL